MPSGIDWVINGGAIGLLVGVITALLAGRLIPKRTHDSQVNNIKEVAELWKTAAKTSEETLKVLAPAVTKLVQYAETTDHALTGIRVVVDEIRRDKAGEADARS